MSLRTRTTAEYFVVVASGDNGLCDRGVSLTIIHIGRSFVCVCYEGRTRRTLRNDPHLLSVPTNHSTYLYLRGISEERSSAYFVQAKKIPTQYGLRTIRKPISSHLGPWRNINVLWVSVHMALRTTGTHCLIQRRPATVQHPLISLRVRTCTYGYLIVSGCLSQTRLLVI